MTTALRLKKGDTVQMLTGKDRGKQGRILDALPRDGKVVVENLNVMTKHQKPKPIRDASRMGGTQIAPGGRIEIPAAVAVSNVMLVCPTCKLPTRVGYRFKEAKSGDQVKVRVCKRDGCGQEIDK
jgi:large subunit ribosomal protein L24